MARVLQRPMFKLGGSSDGVGITSGFRRTGYSWGGGEYGSGSHHPPAPEEEIKEKIIEVQKGHEGSQYDEQIEEIKEKILNPEKAKYGKDDLLWDMYETSKGATDWKDWISGGADLELERRKAKKL